MIKNTKVINLNEDCYLNKIVYKRLIISLVELYYHCSLNVYGWF